MPRAVPDLTAWGGNHIIKFLRFLGELFMDLIKFRVFPSREVGGA